MNQDTTQPKAATDNISVKADRAAAARRHALIAGKRYLTGANGRPVDLPTMPELHWMPAQQLVRIPLPDWAKDLGIGEDHALIVDASCVIDRDGPRYENCDWLLAAFLHLESWLERSVEQEKGPIHSYSLRLPRDWSLAYDHAWANRIFLFLRRWAARQADLPETALFGERPRACFVLTHDVDALSKSLQLRLKSTAMSGIVTARHLLAGRWRQAIARFGYAARYAVTASNYWLFDEICHAEMQRGFRSIYLFADERTSSGASGWLIDPSYRTDIPALRSLMERLRSAGWGVGIHPGFNSWNDSAALETMRRLVGDAAGGDIRLCRQHWLRFSLADTWKAQHAAGIRLDFTLGFNERPGFRNGAALRYRPWDHETDEPIGIETYPTILMDSHFYDYAFPGNPKEAMRPWIEEVVFVGGEASIVWHNQTMHADYGWGPGYLALLDLIQDSPAEVIVPAA